MSKLRTVESLSLAAVATVLGLLGAAAGIAFDWVWHHHEQH